LFFKEPVMIEFVSLPPPVRDSDCAVFGVELQDRGGERDVLDGDLYLITNSERLKDVIVMFTVIVIVVCFVIIAIAVTIAIVTIIIAVVAVAIAAVVAVRIVALVASTTTAAICISSVAATLVGS
jgi:subtilase family serine protease